MVVAATWISQLIAVPEKQVESRIILLWEKVLVLTEDPNAGHGAPESTDVQEGVLKVLNEASDARVAGGFLGVLGLGSYLHTLEFRVLCRTVAAALAARLVRGAGAAQKLKRAEKLHQRLDGLRKELTVSFSTPANETAFLTPRSTRSPN